MMSCYSPSSEVRGSAANQVERLLLTPKEAAQAMTISPRTLWTLTNSGQILHVRIGRSVRYDVADLRRWIERRKSGSLETKGG